MTARHDRQVWASDLVLQSDIVARTSVNPTTLANLVSGRKNLAASFPRPVQGRGKCGIWVWPEVQEWFETVYWPSRTPNSSHQRDPRPACKGRRAA